MSEIAASAVEVSRAALHEKALIGELFQFYTYDWSEMEPAGSTNFEVGADGRFAAFPHLDKYWAEEKRWPYLIRVGAAIAGFALVNTHSYRGRAIDFNMAEFFILRKHRGSGVAAAACQRLLQLHPGRWEIAVAGRNTRARQFWEKAIRSA
ncbi:MAG TPA: GNAT family N-acetyltransferase, partial [Verrucomicrobiae bacterium]|nr:GNAT family N-acetyltransferase [Verrucomicrobiae bacterium]